MKKDLLTHFSFLVSFFIFISLFRGWIAFEFLPFWYGGIIGTLLPDLDHLIYIYFTKPHELTSQRVSSLISDKKYKKSWDILASTRMERANLIFHTAYFQIVFIVFAFLVATSSGSLIGSGIVLSFLLHLLVDQLMDLNETKNLDNWFSKILIINDGQQRKWYLGANLIILLLIGFLF